MTSAMSDDEQAEYADWLENRPQPIKDLMREFPWGTRHHFRNGDLFVIGWYEDNRVAMSKVNPRIDKDLAEREIISLDVEFLRSTRVTLQ